MGVASAAPTLISLQMKENEVIMLYEGDVWLSNSSLNLLAIFTSKANLNVYLSDMLARNIIDAYGYDCLSGNNPTAGWQTQMDNVAYMVEFVEVNPTKYDD